MSFCGLIICEKMIITARSEMALMASRDFEAIGGRSAKDAYPNS